MHRGLLRLEGVPQRPGRVQPKEEALRHRKGDQHLHHPRVQAPTIHEQLRLTQELIVSPPYHPTYFIQQMRNRHRITDQYYKPQPLRPIFQQNELEQGMWIQLIPHKLKMVIVEPGTGPTPKVGEFIRLKQFVYLENMVNIKQERVTYTFGRKRLLPGLQYCLSLCRQSFKGRFYIDAQLAYGIRSIPGIPANSNLIIDVQINAITVEPLSTGQYDDQEFLTQIIAKAKDGDNSAKTGNYIDAQRCYEYSFQRIQSTRCKEIKNYLYNQSKISYMISNGEKTQAEINKEISEVVEMYKIFDTIKIKTVEMALVNRDYYKVIMLTRQCMMESRLEQNQRVLAARSRAFVEVGQFQAAIKIMRHLHDKAPEQPAYQAQLNRILQKQKEHKKFTQNMTCQPVLALTIPNTRSKRKPKRKARKYYEQDNYQGDADESMMMRTEPMQLGMHIGYQDLQYFD